MLRLKLIPETHFEPFSNATKTFNKLKKKDHARKD